MHGSNFTLYEGTVPPRYSTLARCQGTGEKLKDFETLIFNLPQHDVSTCMYECMVVVSSSKCRSLSLDRSLSSIS